MKVFIYSIAGLAVLGVFLSVVILTVAQFVTASTFLPVILGIIGSSAGLFGMLYVQYVRRGFSVGQALERLTEDGIDLLMLFVFFPVILRVVSFGYLQHDVACITMLGGVPCPWFMTATIQLGLIVFGPLALLRIISSTVRLWRLPQQNIHFALVVLKALPAIAMSGIFIVLLLFLWQ